MYSFVEAKATLPVNQPNKSPEPEIRVEKSQGVVLTKISLQDVPLNAISLRAEPLRNSMPPSLHDITPQASHRYRTLREFKSRDPNNRMQMPKFRNLRRPERPLPTIFEHKEFQGSFTLSPSPSISYIPPVKMLPVCESLTELDEYIRKHLEPKPVRNLS